MDTQNFIKHYPQLVRLFSTSIELHIILDIMSYTSNGKQYYKIKKTIAEEIGCNEKTVYNYIYKLVKQGYIIKETFSKYNGNKGGSKSFLTVNIDKINEELEKRGITSEQPIETKPIVEEVIETIPIVKEKVVEKVIQPEQLIVKEEVTQSTEEEIEVTNPTEEVDMFKAFTEINKAIESDKPFLLLTKIKEKYEGKSPELDEMINNHLSTFKKEVVPTTIEEVKLIIDDIKDYDDKIKYIDELYYVVSDEELILEMVRIEKKYKTKLSSLEDEYDTAMKIASSTEKLVLLKDFRPKVDGKSKKITKWVDEKIKEIYDMRNKLEVNTVE